MLPVTFLSLAVVINLRNWIYYYIKIGEMVYLSDESIENIHFYTNSKRNISILNVFTHIMIIVNLLFMVISTTISIVGNKE